MGNWLRNTLLPNSIGAAKRRVAKSDPSPTPVVNYVPPNALSYDGRFGTAIDANGWITFALNAGNRRVWLDSSRADDTGDGLSAATAKKTYNAAFAVFTGAGFNAGDQLMIAGPGTYTDAGGEGTMDHKGGASKAYPTAILSYDRSAPSDTTKYGRLTGSNMPVVDVSAWSSPSMIGAASADGNYLAVQGIEFKGNNVSQCAITYIDRRDGIAYQNCRFNAVRLILDATSTTTGHSQAAHVSKSSFWGQWRADNGNSSGMFLGDVDALYVQDCVFAHCGWKIGASRDDATTAGGTSSSGLGHGTYYGSTCLGGHFDRVVYVDSSADGYNMRGSVTGTCIVAWDEPIAITIGGFSGDYTENPSGNTHQTDDILVMGGANINTSTPRSCGIQGSNYSSATLNNIAFFDNPGLGGVGGAIDIYDVTGCDNALQIDQFATFNNFRGYHYASALTGTHGTQAGKVHNTWTNCVLDMLAPGTGNSTWGTAPSGYQTRDQVITTMLSGMGLTPAGTYTLRKAQLVNAMLWRPDMNWAASLQWIGLPTMGLSPTKTPSTSPPNYTGITPAAIY